MSAHGGDYSIAEDYAEDDTEDEAMKAPSYKIEHRREGGFSIKRMLFDQMQEPDYEWKGAKMSP